VVNEMAEKSVDKNVILQQLGIIYESSEKNFSCFGLKSKILDDC